MKKKLLTVLLGSITFLIVYMIGMRFLFKHSWLDSFFLGLTGGGIWLIAGILVTLYVHRKKKFNNK